MIENVSGGVGFKNISCALIIIPPHSKRVVLDEGFIAMTRKSVKKIRLEFMSIRHVVHARCVPLAKNKPSETGFLMTNQALKEDLVAGVGNVDHGPNMLILLTS